MLRGLGRALRLVLEWGSGVHGHPDHSRKGGLNMNISWDIAFYYTTNEAYRAFLSTFHTNMLALGWVQTGDTGQPDLTSVARPEEGTYPYLIYRMNDALAGNAPVILKIGFSHNGNSNGALSVQVGFSTDGSGNFTSQATTVYNRVCNNCPTININMNGDAGRLCLYIGTNATTNTQAICIVERFLDANGNGTDEGAILIAGASHDYCVTLARNDSIAIDTGNYLPAITPRNVTSLTLNNKITVTPVTPIGWNGLCHPMKSILSYFSQDMARNTEYTISHYGEDVKFNTFSSTLLGTVANIHRISGSSLLFRVN